MEKINRVAIYARVSTDEQAEHGYSIDAQLETLRNYCTLYKKQIVGEYVDRGISGKSIEGRYELQRLIQDVKAGLIDEVTVWKFNRMARKSIDLLQIVDILEKNNVTFRSFSENFETQTPMGRFGLQMMGAVGELERNTIVDNVKMGHRQRAKTGKHNGKVPIGYRIEGSANGRGRETKLVIVEEEALLIRKIFELYASGQGLKAIANQLNREGYLTGTKNPFSTCAVRDLLDNPMFVGKIRYNQYENWGEKRRRGKNDHPILVDGQHPPIINRNLWDKVQLLRKKKSFMPKKRFEGEYLLTGIIRCPECGAAMTASRTVNTNKDGTKVTRMYYSCGNFRSKGSSVCHANSIRKIEAEKAVMDRIQNVLDQPQILKAIVKSVNERKSGRIKPLRDELSGVNARIAILEGKRRKYLGLYELDQIDRDLFSERLKDINSELDNELTQKSRLELELQGDGAEPVPFELVRSLIERLDDLLRKSPFEQRKTLMHLIVKKINLDDKRRVKNVELCFDSETEKHFLSVAPSAEQMAEGAFSVIRESPEYNQTLSIII
ncbi:site-specific DNA recombinase [Paenibacillus sophorae]|uniref:Recombinase family protein n=1 Tax=Paenibacillus sophorae TaxID=1333845 RepID=A0A1H8TKE5_9BACL|nr:recombinase family protein [Paenibacillus sophorae]QWU16246.1 recombinase family protein [Paenibacillus sophorae]SEO91024.1 site-specific DNA recombinase [Paenibacillus sophorae]